MRILLTGGSGFIGSQVLKRLVRQGHDVSAIVRPDGDRSKIETSISSFELLEFDLKNVEDAAAVLAEGKFELCIHLAWFAEPGLYLGSIENTTSLSSTLRLASILARSGCRKFVGVGTCFEYDFNDEKLSESSPLNPDSLYSACKTAAAVGLRKITRDSGMQTAWSRLFYQYGPFEDHRRLVPAILASLIDGEIVETTEGGQARDFLHVEDVASAICAVGFSELTGTVNVGSGQPVLVREIVQKLGEIIGREDLIEFGALPYRDGDPMYVCADNRRLKDNTDWRPKYDLDSGLRHTAAWWMKELG